MRPATRTLAGLAALAAGLALSAPAAAAHEEPPPRAAVPLITILRDTRCKTPPSGEETIGLLVAPGPSAIPHLVDLLVRRRLPALDLEQRIQTLSLPQRELILGALARWKPATVLAELEARLADGATLEERAAALWMLAAVGDARHVPRALDLALARGETATDPDVEEALVAAVERILRRDPKGYDALGTQLEKSRSELHEPLVLAIGSARDPRGIALFSRLLRFHRELASPILSQARLLGRSPELEANRALAREALEFLDGDRVELRCAAARALGELHASEHVPRLIELLDADDAPVRESALWALRRISRLQLSPDARAWSRWHSGEEAFWTKQMPSLLAQIQRGSRASKAQAASAMSSRSLYRDELALEVSPLLSELDPVLRLAACRALAALASPTSTEVLVQALDDAAEDVRQAAHAALVAIVGTPLPNESESCRRQLRL